MDPQLSLLMANQAQIRKGDVVIDPFVGSGSLLVAAATFGGKRYFNIFVYSQTNVSSSHKYNTLQLTCGVRI